MSTKDIIKSSVYENLAGGTGLSAVDVAMILGLACLLGLYIYLVHRFSSKAAFYSKDLGITIAGMPVVVATIMVAMQSNLIVSLGMVGALSIVRFRNAIKNPLDLLYLFWSISAGIICGVGLKVLALLLCIVMTVLVLIMTLLPNVKANAVLVLRTEKDNIDWNDIEKTIKDHAKYYKEKVRSIRNGETEVIYEISSKSEKELICELKKYELEQVNYLSHAGEYRV